MLCKTENGKGMNLAPTYCMNMVHIHSYLCVVLCCVPSGGHRSWPSRSHLEGVPPLFWSLGAFTQAKSNSLCRNTPVSTSHWWRWIHESTFLSLQQFRLIVHRANFQTCAAPLPSVAKRQVSRALQVFLQTQEVTINNDFPDWRKHMSRASPI